MITKEQVVHIAKLARLKLTEEEIVKFQKDFSSILDYFGILQSLDTKNVEPLTHSVAAENVEREDVEREADPAFSQELVDMAPSQDQGFLQVKEVFGNDK
ncbi:MAG: hypothetical protein A2842_01915 [Candidatus Wildermuthbacteria bacterium RIFCSPHIGHO2_01_FULL_48_25]|uniref:Aspartyl/glutamyl-tRNA(Asn/Gln) amidotransferase subunit C n=1 Tax=Candidatus Wildermuthbacteria bacterium RIFCSPLOWO2_01_FULL_48_16 TaxID=1802461 RepID=A0A1G2RN38_9BACT|nr:MAG: hypothetical protein A2842_01915 [Candidatus Wildermuthbacteria bacterium RIFCSPHIGHO2_01_FULL_48_25]OHA69274.1 MAG: hypothetical protein A3J57_01835 [Candidatus Wildermuthbacteria bacterium RIFCSPHIGHO2_02_FULL_49_12b]OHA73431.1 MAG: hypothetical protein A3B24_02380 [Candidatus Wildermuthbacteria bacterium RIFCSPLOWO2_01_FULL_48_16]